MGDIMKEKKNIPEIRFEGFVGEWEIRKLEEISDSYSGGTPSVGISEFYNGFIPFIRSAEINKNSTELYITELGLLNSSAKLVDVGNILYALYGATSGEVGRSQVKGAINQAILAIIPKNGFDAEFIMQYLRKKKKEIISTYLQGGQGNLSGAIVKKLNIDLPKYVEQSQIGTFFQNLDKQITLEQQKHDKLVTLKKAMLEKMFPKEGASVPEIRFEGFEGEWVKKRLEDFCSYHSSNLSYNSVIANGQYELYDANGVIGYSNDYFLDSDYITIIKDGSGVGRVRLLPKNTSFIGTMGAFKVKDSDIRFLLCCLLITDFSKHVIGATIPHIYFSNYGKEEYFVPSIEEQSQIGSYFQNLDNLISLQQQKINKLKNIKKACLDKMFV
jgi:type I restriction enzyme S subunit